jgi:hypothetical protein
MVSFNLQRIRKNSNQSNRKKMSLMELIIYQCKGIVYSETIAVGFARVGWNSDFNIFQKMTATKILSFYI